MDYKESLNRLVFRGLIGSHLYGTATGSSDVDTRGVFIAPYASHYMGFDKVESCQNPDKQSDEINFEYKHFINLCLKGSPGQIELLFNPPFKAEKLGELDDDTLYRYGMLWIPLYLFRNQFLSKRLYYTFGGFAQSDMKKIIGESTRNCGVKGKILIETFGYNTKHASNAYRLSVTLSSLLETEHYSPILSAEQAQEALFIKKGHYTKEQFFKIMEELEAKNKELFSRTKLRENPDIQGIKSYCQGLIIMYFDEERRRADAARRQ